MKRQLLLGSIQNPSIYIIAITISSIRNPSFASLDSERVGWHVVVAAVILGFVRSLNQGGKAGNINRLACHSLHEGHPNYISVNIAVMYWK
ncbi:uncharacterized protein LAJ45_11126 [Morchella importuna]|uniref:uncharacterized protein n=1 Tax=Morchella importuna TaxID=1174673 RepID=UPI001E8DA3C4|nr:uncharacterized protein LAJ45_11126 [Morchella importuna]KAH8144856.1 hypothetical protein LAJ45_11126 [Morchella importuna]